MDSFTFTLKRGHLVSVKLLRDFTLPEGLTPARFDILYLLHRMRGRLPFQWRIAKFLGVSRPTICRMIRALRSLGIVEVTVDRKIARCRRISLTRIGRRHFARALKLIRRGKVAAAIRAAWRTALLSRAEVRKTIDETQEGVLRYCRGLDDHVALYQRSA